MMLTKRNLIPFAVVAMAIVTICSCGGKEKRVPFDSGDSTSNVLQDKTVYGVCGDGTAMHTLQIITDLGDTVTFDIAAAVDNNKVFGGLQAGDRIAVVPGTDKNTAVCVINQTSLLGNWVMPNPLDGSDEVGFSIKEGGVVEGIEQSSIIYKTWRLLNGQLEVVSERESGGGIEDIALYNIIKLTADSLIIKDTEDIFEYGRQQTKKEHSDIKLEEASSEDLKI